jgi:AraC-like DNA-binding protein
MIRLCVSMDLAWPGDFLDVRVLRGLSPAGDERLIAGKSLSSLFDACMAGIELVSVLSYSTNYSKRRSSTGGSPEGEAEMRASHSIVEHVCDYSAVLGAPLRSPEICDNQDALFTVTAENFGSEQLSIRYVKTFFGPERARALMQAAGLCDTTGQMPLSISRVAFWNLCVDGIYKYNDEGHGCTPRPLPKGSWTIIFTAVNHMDSVGEGLKHFCEFVRVIPSGMSVSVGHGSDGVHISYAMSELSERGEIYVELIALVFHCVLMWGTARTIEPVRIRLSTLLDDYKDSLLTGLATSSWRQGTGVSVVYPKEILNYPLGVRRYKSFSFHETSTFMEMAEKPVLATDAGAASSVINDLRILMREDVPNQRVAAHRLGMSAATLQRRLSQEGTSFRELSREVRMRKLCTLLATDANLDDIAFDLGFSDRRSLWRACVDWLGMSPTAYRLQRRHSDA